MTLMHIVDGKTVESVRGGFIKRFARFLVEPFVAAWHHRDLIAAVLTRELNERFKGSAAGWVWAVFAPLLSLATYVWAFSGAVNLPNNGKASSPADYALFIFGGLVTFNFFSEMLYRAPSLMHEYSHYIKQTMFPAQMLPVISTLRATVYATIGLAVMLVAQLVLGGTLHWTVLFLPLWFVPFLAFLMGLTWLLSSMGAFARDTAHLMTTLAPVLMFATPVFFSNETLAAPWNTIMYANVMTGFIEIVRDLVVFGHLPSAAVCLWTIFLSASMFWFGYWFFGRNRDGMADVL